MADAPDDRFLSTVVQNKGCVLPGGGLPEGGLLRGGLPEGNIMPEGCLVSTTTLALAGGADWRSGLAMLIEGDCLTPPLITGSLMGWFLLE